MPINPITLTKSIKELYTKYLTSSFPLRDEELRNLFLEKIKEYNFFKGPFIQAIPPFVEGKFLKDLIDDGIFSKKFDDFIFEAIPYLFNHPLYQHQESAIRKIVAGRNAVISSGTGSGKTEAFLLPILEYLIKEFEQDDLRPGVRALLLYPMNALANDQLSRIRKIVKEMHLKFPSLNISFGRYTGETPEKKREGMEIF